MYHVYLLYANEGRRTYIGVTNEPFRRLQQHNRERSGGAKSTAGYVWAHACIVSGFPDMRSALQFEWMWKHLGRKHPGLAGKLGCLCTLWTRGKSTSTSICYAQLESVFYVSFPSADGMVADAITPVLDLCVPSADCAPLFPTYATHELACPNSPDFSV